MKTKVYQYLIALIIGGACSVGTLPSVLGYSGQSPLPPGLNASDVLLFEDFESAVTLLDGPLSNSASSITSTTAFSGQRSLEMHNSDAGKFSSRFPLGGGWDVLYARYMFRMGDAQSACWNTSQHYKNMGFEGGTSDCKGGNYTSDGTDCFTVRTRFNYPYLGVHVESAPYPGEFDDVNSVNATDGKWHCLEMRVKLNTPGAKDGEIRHWVDGHEQVHNQLEFRIVPGLRITKWWFTYWSNDNWCGPLYLDDLVISKARIGCASVPSSDTTPPAPPTGVHISQ